MSVLRQRTRKPVWNQDAAAPDLRNPKKHSNDRADTGTPLVSVTFRPGLGSGQIRGSHSSE